MKHIRFFVAFSALIALYGCGGGDTSQKEASREPVDVHAPGAQVATDVPRAPRSVALVVAADVLLAARADVDALAKAIADERKVTTMVMSAPSTAVAVRSALQDIRDLWGVMLIGDVPAAINKTVFGDYPDDNPYRVPNCTAYQFAADGNSLTSDSLQLLAATQCRNGAWTARIKGRTPQTQLADVTGFIKKDLRLRSSYGNWNPRYQYLQAAWHSGFEFPDYTKYWSANLLYSNTQINYVKTGSGSNRKDAFVACLTAPSEFCVANLHGSPDAIYFEGPGIVGQTYSADSVSLPASELAQLQKRAKVLFLMSCSTGNFLAAINPDGYFAGNALFGGDTLLVLAGTTVTVVSGGWEAEQIAKKYHLLATGSSFADIDTMESTPMHYFGDPTITLRPPASGPQPKLVIDNQRYHGPSYMQQINFPDSVSGAMAQKQVVLRNDGNAQLKIQLTFMPEFVGVDNAIKAGALNGAGFTLESPNAFTDDGDSNLGNVIFTVEPGKTLSLTYGFSPVKELSGSSEWQTRYGKYTGRMEIHSNDPELGRVFLELKGTARAQ